jgi:hypothetical protein
MEARHVHLGAYARRLKHKEQAPSDSNVTTTTASSAAAVILWLSMLSPQLRGNNESNLDD